MPSRDTPDEPDSQPSKRAALVFVGGLVLTLAVVGAIVLITSGGEDQGAPAEGAAMVDCTPVADDGGDESCPTEVDNAPADVAVKTSEGDFEITLDVRASPATTTSFRHLVEDGFYDGLNFSRVVPGFVIQGGDPLADEQQGAGSGGPGYYVDEPVPPEVKYTRGVVAMAKTGTDPAGRSGSQFFVVSGQDAGLPPDYAYIGNVVSGLDTVKRIESLGVGDGPPRREVTIEGMTLAPPATS